MTDTLQVQNSSSTETVEEDMPVCDDTLDGGSPDPSSSGRERRSFDPNELTWNIDRLDERTLPLDGQYCPAADGMCYNLHII